mmetsp:Transcript_9841/g.14786  ORF Transcript_9841/g.14786 Transcript_9841/m.14786 type:complete len:185 (+) Transcript_9841:124-678(+)
MLEIQNCHSGQSISSMTSVGSATMRLTFKQMQDCEDVFSVFELDDSTVDAEHLGPMISALVINSETKPSQEDIDHLSTKVRGKMDFTHFFQLVAPYIEKANEHYSKEKIDAAFKRFDIDGNGYISISELRTVLGDSFGGKMKDVIDPLDDKDVEEIMAEADLDGDGRISYAEFSVMIPHLSDCI